MNATQAFLASVTPGMDIIAGVSDLPADTVGPDTLLLELAALHQTYFGKTNFAAKQRAAVAAAREAGQSLTALNIIERYSNRLRKQRDIWDLRVELCGLNVSESELERFAAQRVRDIQPPALPAPGIRLRRPKDKNWTMSITASSEDIADMAAALGKTVEEAKEFFFGKEGEEKAGRASKITNVVIPLDDLARVVEGDGEEITLRMTNGATITGARLVQALLNNIGLATLVDPVEGPVNLYRLQRFASDKQRTMALAENPLCAWPDCNQPGEESQIHHLHAWQHGGHTNPKNLCTLCPYHNGINTDNPNAPPHRGRMIRSHGSIEWQPPWAEPVKTDRSV